MNDRKILAYHHQFDSLRLDGMARLFEVVDHLRFEVRGCSTGFAYTEYPGTLVEFFEEESRRYTKRGRPAKRGRPVIPMNQRPRHPDAMYAPVCMTVDLADGWIRRLGFPLYKLNKLWFPELSSRPTYCQLYEHIRALDRPR